MFNRVINRVVGYIDLNAVAAVALVTPVLSWIGEDRRNDIV